MSSVMGRLPHTFGKERVGYSCGTLFVDHASGKIVNFCQYSTNADETITNKHRLESHARQDGVTIKGYHADNGVFASKAFKDDCDCLHQSYTFSGVGVHHQNGVTERNIKTVAQGARANMLHFAHHWPARAKV
jgi:transposase InsO family protein